MCSYTGANLNKLCLIVYILYLADPGWYDAGNCFQYLKSDKRRNWEESRNFCQQNGGDLAYAGIRDLSIRR